MIRQVACIVGMFECDSERRRAVSFSAHASRRLRAANEVVAVVADLRSDSRPVCATLQRLSNRVHNRSHSCSTNQQEQTMMIHTEAELCYVVLTVVELAVGLLAVDDVEAVFDV